MTQSLTDPISPPVFLDVSTLIEASRPVQRVNWFWYVLGALVLLTLLGNIGGSKDPEVAEAFGLLTGTLTIAAVVTGVVGSILRVRKLRAQQQMVEAIDEMMQLRRWEPAGMLLDRFLSAPVRSVRLWAQALVQLSSLLGRHHRFEDAIVVQNFLIENELLDDSSDYVMRLGRAMMMLREDSLVDADRAISDLRKRGPSQGNGGLALVEMFRDVTTGHPDEAIKIFAKHLPQMQQQLGHRVADAHALVARAYDLQGQTAEAQAAYSRATVLAPLSELQRRYPDLLKMADKYRATPAPLEAA
jgi:tetratricopeptide (TPR) repeat protein